MKKKSIIIAGSIAGGLLLLAVITYLGLAFYYKDGFQYGTVINGQPCVGMTVKEANDVLTGMIEYNTVELIDKFGTSYPVNMDQIDFTIDYSKDLKKIKESQNPYLWILALFEPQEYVANYKITFDEEKLEQVISSANCVRLGVYDPNAKTEIAVSSNGYVLLKHSDNLVMPNKVFEVAKEAVYGMQESVDLVENKCYIDRALTEADKQVCELFNKMDAFQSFELTYDIYDNRQEILSKAQVCKWMMRDEAGELVFDEEGNILLDETKVSDYVNAFADKYDTIGRPHEFTTTKGDVVTIEKSTYGNAIDREKETALLIEAFTAKDSGKRREPEYKVRAWGQGEDDIGDTYIEVDIEEQHLYYYVDGELALETDVVTGNAGRRLNTPKAVCYVYGKQKNRVLRGLNYATFVYYWMPVNGNIGLHDATWRKEFGGEIYKTSGSHGCINMPKEKAGELYEMVEIGTPCIIF